MKRTRASNPEFPKRISLYENDEGLALLRALAQRRGVSDSALLRILIREEARRLKVKAEDGGAE